MTFKNPNMITSISKDEFYSLKKQVEKIQIELEEIKKSFSIKSDNKIENNKDMYTLLDTDIKSAKLGGTPRIAYFKFDKSNEEVSDQIDSIDQVNDLANNVSDENVEMMQTDNLNVENDDFDSIIDISTIIDENKSYKIKGNDFQISNAKTSSGHRTYLVNDEQLERIKESYVPTSKIIAA